MTDLRDRIEAALADYTYGRNTGLQRQTFAALLAEVLASMPKAGATFTLKTTQEQRDKWRYALVQDDADDDPGHRAVLSLLDDADSASALARDLAAAQDALRTANADCEIWRTEARELAASHPPAALASAKGAE